MIGKKKKEAYRLCSLLKETFKAKPYVTKVSEAYLITILIKRKTFSYKVGLEQLQGSEEERNKNFAQFIVDSIFNYNRR